VAADLSASAYDFLRVVWPAILPLVGGGRLLPVEAAASKDLVSAFDRLAGIDAWQLVDTAGAMRGIASRVQWGPNWRTFNLRRFGPSGAATEYDKRLWALDHAESGWLLPALTIHAYLTLPRREGFLLEAAVVRTRDLLHYIRTHPCSRPRTNPDDGVRFDWWSWDALRRAGVKVHIARGGTVDTAAQQQPTRRLAMHSVAEPIQLPLLLEVTA